MALALSACAAGAHAALAAAPAWYDSNVAGVSPDWHYRTALTLSAAASVNTTAVVSIDFTALLAQMGVVGTLDVNSIRVVRPNGALAAVQEFTPNVFNGATNATAGRGEVRFLVQDAAGVYQVYFDITQNGSKPANTSTPINGNFERDAAGTRPATSWTVGTVAAGYDAQVRPSESPSIATNGTVAGNGASPRTVDGTPFTGDRSYLIGARTNNEGADGFPTVTITKTINVPATNPGSLTFRYRIQGWDSNVNGNTTTYDFLAVRLSATGVATANLVGPAANNYVTRPFSPNYGTQSANAARSGYGQYNGWDIDTNNVRRGVGGVFMTLARGAEPWFTVTQDLTAFAGRTATLTFTFSNTTVYKSWAHIDDVEWSVVTPTLGAPVAFGVAVTSPTLAPAIVAGNTLSISAAVDAAPGAAVFADILNDVGVVVASNILLFNDGTRGSSAAAPNVWVNNGSDPANPTYTVPITTLSSTAWTVRARAADGSSSSLGAALKGLARRPGLTATAATEANFFNVDDQLFAVSGRAFLGHVKTVAMFSDPVNGQTNPKAIPGARVTYAMTVSNNGGGPVDASTLVLTDRIPTNTKMCLTDFATPGQGPVEFVNGPTPSGLTYTFSGLGSGGDSLSFSNNAGVSYLYTPTLDAEGCDAAITHVRIAPAGTMPAATATTTPSFTARLRVQIL